VAHIAEAVLRDTTYRGYPLIHSLNDRRVLGYVNRGDLARTLGVSAAAFITDFFVRMNESKVTGGFSFSV
jgi:hypothetical protein